MEASRRNFNTNSERSAKKKIAANGQQDKQTWKKTNSTNQVKGAISDEVYVGNFCYTYDKAKLNEIFLDYSVQNIRMHVKSQKAYAFLTLSNQQEAERVVREMKGKVIDGRRILVKPAKGALSSDNDRQYTNQYKGLPPLEPISQTDYSNMPPLESVEEFWDLPPLEPLEEYSNMPPLEPIERCKSVGSIDEHCVLGGASGAVDDQKAPEPLGQIVLGNFPYGSSEADLMSIFNEFQPVMCRIYINAPMSRLNRPTYAFVYVRNPHLAAAAEQVLHLTNYRGHVISVKNISQ